MMYQRMIYYLIVKSGRNIIRMIPKTSPGIGVVAIDSNVGLGTTNPFYKISYKENCNGF